MFPSRIPHERAKVCGEARKRSFSQELTDDEIARMEEVIRSPRARNEGFNSDFPFLLHCQNKKFLSRKFLI